MHSCKLRFGRSFAGLVLISIGWAAAHSSASTIVGDDFEIDAHPTGSRTVVTGGASGIPFYSRNAIGAGNAASLVSDAGAGTFNSTVLNQSDTTTAAGGNELIGVLPSTVTLANTNDFINLSFSFRYTNAGAASANSAGFRFGIENSNGTPVNADGQTSTSDNDKGYYVQTGVGTGQAPASTNVLFQENGGTFPILGGLDRTTSTANTAGVTIADTNTHTVSLSITRASSTQVNLSAIYDGGGPINLSFTSSPIMSFDEIAFGDGFVAAPVIFDVDNVVVTSNVPEPATVGLLAVGARRSRFAAAGAFNELQADSSRSCPFNGDMPSCRVGALGNTIDRGCTLQDSKRVRFEW